MKLNSHIFTIPGSLASQPSYPKGQAVQYLNLEQDGDVLRAANGNEYFRTTDLGGPILGLFYFGEGDPSVIACAASGIYASSYAPRISGLGITSIALVSGTTYRAQLSGTPDISSIVTAPTADNLWITGRVNAENTGMFTITAKDNTAKTIDFINPNGVPETGVAGSANVYKGFTHPTWDGAGIDPTFNATAPWGGDTIFDDAAGFSKLLLSNGLAAASGGGNYKIYNTGGVLHYNAAVCLEGASTHVMGSIREFDGRLWGNSSLYVNGVAGSGPAAPENWTTPTGVYNNKIGSAGERVNVLAKAKDSLYCLKENNIYKIIGKDFVTKDDAQVVGPLGFVGAGTSFNVFQGRDTFFFVPSCQGIYEMMGDEPVNVSGDMLRTFASLYGYPGFRNGTQEIWFSDPVNSCCYIFDRVNKRWRKRSGSFNQFLNTYDGKYLGGSSASGSHGYVYNIEVNTANRRDAGAAQTVTLETAFTTCGSANIEKSPFSLRIHGFAGGTSVTVTLLYRSSPDAGYSSRVLSSGTSLPYTHHDFGGIRFTECALRITGAQDMRIWNSPDSPGIVLDYCEMRRLF